MNLVWLDDFLALAVSGNFSRAAIERHSSQPAFSRRIRGLEEWLGVELFDRSTQPATLTEAGEWFRSVAHDVGARIARLPEEAQARAEASSGTLRIASTHALSFTFLPRWLRRHEAGTALGPVQLVSDVLGRCEVLMTQHKVQFVLSHAHPKARGALDGDDYLSVKIGSDVLIPVSSPDDAGRPRHRLKEKGGPKVSVLGYTDESGLGRILRAVVGRRLEAAAIRIGFTAHLASVLRTMALDGRGIAWLPQSLIEEDIREGRLVAAAGPAWNVPLEIRLFRERELVGQAATALWRVAAEA